jgi:metal-dependent amidase/aminoacylase/carboxypeptidase family protein
VGSAPIDKEPLSVPHHCSHFDFDERALLVGASVFMEVVERKLEKFNHLSKIHSLSPDGSYF